MNLADVMDEIGAKLDTIDGLRVYPYPADTITPVAAVLSYPEVTYDETMRRGMDRYSLPLWIVVGKANDRAAQKNIAPLLDGAGPSSVKAKLDGTDYQSCDSVRVQMALPDVITIASIDYLGYQFTLDIAGQGAP